MTTGTILGWADGSTLPANHLECDGAAVSRTTYADLFTAIGTTYGAGDGSTTFNLPDLQGRMAIGLAGAGTASTLGETGGAIDHTHVLDGQKAAAQMYTFTDGVPSSWTYFRRVTAASWTANQQSVITSINNAVGNATAGLKLSGNSDTGNPPYLVVRWVIAT